MKELKRGDLLEISKETRALGDEMQVLDLIVRNLQGKTMGYFAFRRCEKILRKMATVRNEFWRRVREEHPRLEGYQVAYDTGGKTIVVKGKSLDVVDDIEMRSIYTKERARMAEENKARNLAKGKKSRRKVNAKKL